MPAMAPVILKDSAGVDHTFKPDNAVPGVASFVEKTGVPLADRKLSVAVNRTQTGRIKTQMKISIPTVVTETIGGVNNPRVVRTIYADLTFASDPAHSLEDRIQIASLIQKAFDSGLIGDMLFGLEQAY